MVGTQDSRSPRQLSWSHLKFVIYLDDPLKRDFYAEMCRIKNWSIRTLQQKINGKFFERTALSKKPDQSVRQELKALRDTDKMPPDLVFRDSYILDFLGLKDTDVEKDVELAILREIEGSILELGIGFAFLERQKRIQIDARDYYLELLELAKSGIHVGSVGSYWTAMLPKKKLERKLHDAVLKTCACAPRLPCAAAAALK